MNYIFYFARYNPIHLRKVNIDQNVINLGVVRKVNSISELITNSNYRVIIFRTSTGISSNKKLLINRIGKKIIISPPEINVFLRPVNYFFNILFGLYYSIIFSRRIKAKYSIFWDFLPDTLLLAIASYIFSGSKLIADIEEFIQKDPLSPFIFKIFEKIFFLFSWDRVITCNTNLTLPFSPKKRINLSGFFAENLQEEMSLNKKIFNQKKRKENKYNILFSGRIDKVRGAFEFIQLSRKFENDRRFRFQIFGFGQKKEIQKLKKIAGTNVEFKLFSSRSNLLDGIINSTFCFNYISDFAFSNNSFPSKVAEFYSLGNIILSNHCIDDLNQGILYFSNIQEASNLIKKNFKKSNPIIDKTTRTKRLEKFSISSKIVIMEKFLK